MFYDSPFMRRFASACFMLVLFTKFYCAFVVCDIHVSKCGSLEVCGVLIVKCYVCLL